MSFRCPPCGYELIESKVNTLFADVQGWYCVRCNVFIEREDLMDIICNFNT